MQVLFRIAAGILLLCFGRRLFWLFIGLLGFFTGFTLATQFFSEQPQWIAMLIAIGCGLIGILLAFFLQRIAIAIAGFLAGGLFATNLLALTGWQLHPAAAFLICGVLGAILLSILFDWALIFLSALTGATLITRSLQLDAIVETGLIILLIVIGVVIQTRFTRRTAAAAKA